ncbi:hypothetical protein BH23GEM2_BH23GEM2_11560 [soil metagenome]
MQAPTHFRYVEHSGWPRLAWLAKATVGCAEVEVRHGNMVETADDWFCEAVCDGPFEAGDFDRTDLIFGSGARRRSTTVGFISSGSTCDRLHSSQLGDSIWVSNSLACLLTTTGATLDPTASGYATFFESTVKGIREYDRYLPTSLGPVRFTYFNNLNWDGRTLTEVGKPNPSRDFGNFDKYRSFLHASMASVATNMASSARKHAFSMLGTLSSGYDSPAVVALACQHGLTEAISITAARGGHNDSGVEIAKLNRLSENSVSSTPLRRRRLPPSSLSMAAREVRAVALPAARGVDVAMAGVRPGKSVSDQARRETAAGDHSTGASVQVRLPWAIARAGQRYV